MLDFVNRTVPVGTLASIAFAGSLLLGGPQPAAPDPPPSSDRVPATVAEEHDRSPEIQGRVILEGWAEAVPGATVLLLDVEFEELGRAETGPDGSFRIEPPGAGTYYLQAVLGGLAGAPVGPLEVDEDELVENFFLELPSRLLRDALDCFATMDDEATGVLAGLVYEPASDMPLPGARITLQWEAEDGQVLRREVMASESGRYVACGVPAGVPMTAWVRSLGVVSERHPDIVVEPLALARQDLTLDLQRSEASVRIRTGAEPPGGAAGAASVVAGRLLDRQSGRPVTSAIVTLGESGRQDLTDGEGRFRFVGVSPGSHEIAVRHMAYGEHSERIDVVGNSELEVELRLAPQAIQLGEITVRARRNLPTARLAGARPSRTFEGERLEYMEERGAPLYQALYEMPGVRVRYYQPCPECMTDICIEAVGSRVGMGVSGPGCQMVQIFLDGVAMYQDQSSINMLLYGGLQDYERVEFLSPMEAIRWGFSANATGALFLWTKRGPGTGEEQE